jgi:hemoglobin
MMLDEGKTFELLGEAGFTRLVAAFYRRVKADNLLGPLYPPNDFEAAEQRLREFLIQRFGGPPRYSAQRGHPRLRMRHAPFKIDTTAADRWFDLMQQAMAESDLPEPVAAVLGKYFRETATFMINQ